MDTSTEEHRHACEVRTVLAWPADKRKGFIDLVAKKRGAEAAQLLRNDVYLAWVQKQATAISAMPPLSRERRLEMIEKSAGIIKRRDVEAAINNQPERAVAS